MKRSIAGVVVLLLVIALVIVGSRMNSRLTKKAPEVPPSAPDRYTDLYVSVTPDSSWQTILDEYDEYLSSALRKNLASGFAVAIVKDTSILFLRAYGISNYSTGDSVDIHSI